MYNITEKDLNFITNKITSNVESFGYNVNLFGFNSINNQNFLFGRQCHAGLPQYVGNYKVIGNCFNRKFPSDLKEIGENFLEWLVSDDSVYYPLIKKLKETNNYHVIRHEVDNKILAVIVGNPKEVNFKVLTNFFKAGRTLNEHAEKLRFWKKWRVEAGFDPGLVFLMMYNVDHHGNKINNNHSCLESWAKSKSFTSIYGYTNKILLDKFVNRDHNYWDLSLYLGKNSTSYTSENQHTWGIESAVGVSKDSIKKYDFYPHDIKEKSKEISKTFFYHLYVNDINKTMKITDETLRYFFSEGYKEYLIDYKPPQTQQEESVKPTAVKRKIVRKRKVVFG